MDDAFRHEFGGEWTRQKLKTLQKYLKAYMTIMKGNEVARRHFRVWYVDGFAGTGGVTPKEQQPSTADLFEGILDLTTAEFIEGSARVALQTRPEFDGFLFIEKNKVHCEHLHNLRSEFPELASRIEIRHGDANGVLSEWCQTLDSNARAAVFLDPYGMQVKWELLTQLAKTGVVDLWLLFPLYVAMRMLRRDGQIPPGWRECLNALFGNTEWEREFYRKGQQDMFGGVEGLERDVDFRGVVGYWAKRLKEIFPHVATKPRILRDDKNHPLFLLCFAAANRAKGHIAVKIAQDLLRDEDR